MNAMLDIIKLYYFKLEKLIQIDNKYILGDIFIIMPLFQTAWERSVIINIFEEFIILTSDI